MSTVDGPEVWQATLRLLEDQIVPNQIKTWILPMQWLATEPVDGKLHVRLSAPNDWTADWVTKHYQRLIEECMSQVSGSPCRLELITQKREGEPVPSPLDLGHSSASSSQSSSSHRGVVLAAGHRSIGELSLDPRYTFTSFVVGASNQFAHASAIAVAEKPALQYNPLFIYSPPGLGKTHLLQAIGNHILSKNPDTRVGYTSAETFVNELIESLQRKQQVQFRTKFRESFDILLIDDIQFIAGKKATEEEFFNTFNALHSSRRQIVVTSDRPPKEIEGLEERIRTRFEWGLVVDIQPPEIETRIAILKAKAERDDIYLPDEVATFLATHVKSNVRELEGLLIRLQAQASLSGAEISLEMAKQELKASLPDEGSLITVETIQNVVARHFQIKVQDLKSTARTKTVALPRQIAMFLVRKYTGLGLKDIGQFFGGKDHSTILHACNKIENGIENGIEGDPEIRTAVENIQNLL